MEIIFSTEALAKGKGFWKLNCSHLTDREYGDGVNEILEFYLKDTPKEDPQLEYNKQQHVQSLGAGLRWEIVKMKVIDFSKFYSQHKASKKRKHLIELRDRLKKAEKKLAMVNLTSVYAIQNIEKANKKIDEIKIGLNKEMEYFARGAILRSKIRWYRAGEHNSKYFLNLEKAKSKGKIMNATKRHDGSITTNSKEILQIQSDFYKKLYTTNTRIRFDQINTNSPKLSQEQKETLEQPLQMDELAKAVSQMARFKAPGPDGLPADFYKMFFGKIKALLLDVFNEAIEMNRLHISARRGIITLLPKRQRDLLLVKSWRPICLLCCDYKAFSKIITNRMKEYFHQLIHSDQTGFMAGRSIADNIRKASDILDHTSRKNIAAVLISIDFQKAFDRVEYNSLYASMKFLNFGDKFLKWVSVLFQDMELCTVNAGHSSPYFTPTRGLFQGNPVGPMAFNCLIEILAINLRNNRNIEGIRIGQVVHLLSQFADDLDIYMKFKQNSWDALMSTLTDFENMSGMLVNYDKTTVYRLGSIKYTNAKFYSSRKLHWTNGPINVLGCWISHDKEEAVKLNLDEIVVKVKSITQSWLNRDLSLFGKILVLNSLIGSLFVYRMTVMESIPNTYYKTLKEIFTRFLWGKSIPKVKWETLIALKEEGGAGLVNLIKKEESLKMGVVVRMLKTENLRCLADEALGNQLGHLLWETQLIDRHIDLFFPIDNYWKQTLKIWMRNMRKDPEVIDEIKAQVLWLNSYILVGKRPVLYNEFIKEGIMRISDLLTPEHEFMNWQVFQEKTQTRVPFTKYMGLIQAIPKRWKILLKNSRGVGEYSVMLEKWGEAKHTVSMIYKYICETKDLLFDYRVKWEKRGVPFEKAEYVTAFRRLNKLTNVVKLRSFQYRLLLGTTVTNVRLYYYKLKESKNCTFCSPKEESIQHLFYDCVAIKTIFKMV